MPKCTYKCQQIFFHALDGQILVNVVFFQDQYENPEVRQEGPLERTLKQLLTSDEEDSQIKYLKSTFYELMKGDVDNRKSMVENKLRTELRKTMRISEKKNKIVLKKPRTLKAFILDEDKQEMKPGKFCCVFACLRFWGPEGHCFC